MTNKLREAVEFIRRADCDPSPTRSSEYLNALIKLGRAYVAEYPADEDDLADWPRLEALGMADNLLRNWYRVTSVHGSMAGRVEVGEYVGEELNKVNGEYIWRIYNLSGKETGSFSGEFSNYGLRPAKKEEPTNG
jgi:hypothetical protein